MAGREREYGWYRVGCDRLGQTPLSEAEFEARWQEFEDHAERLKAAEASGVPPDVDAAVRAEMQRRIKNDPFVRAILVGMAEETSAG
ncbi:MAG TPA: hypothetical protein VFB38_22990 [Chthonomonadaceae bacterium]|nr:hypothetical protein [Chthonomonadaceae bacterium]